VTTADTRLDHLAVAARYAAAPALWPVAPRYTAAERWYHRIGVEADHEVWLLTWLPGQGTELHDHGGSAGAFHVLSGTLTEDTVSEGGPGGLRLAAGEPDENAGRVRIPAGEPDDNAGRVRIPAGEPDDNAGRVRIAARELRQGAGRVRIAARELGAGAGRRFGSRHIHRIMNRSGRPAISIHVYGPALSTMTRYRITDGALDVVTVEQAGVQW
jgi:hypothetical protein